MIPVAMASNLVPITAQIADLLKRMDEANLDFIKIENLYTFDDERGFSD